MFFFFFFFFTDIKILYSVSQTGYCITHIDLVDNDQLITKLNHFYDLFFENLEYFDEWPDLF